MAMRVPNGTICEIVMYMINCTPYVYTVFTVLFSRKVFNIPLSLYCIHLLLY